MISEKTANWLPFTRIKRIGAIRLKRLMDFFHGDGKAAWMAGSDSFALAKLEAPIAEEIIINRNNYSVAAELDELARHDLSAISIYDDSYPALLSQLYDLPPLLFYRGDISITQGNCLGVVGARKFTSYGQQAADSLVGELAAAGLIIVSGLALGIDALAHGAALKNNGLTIGVLGSGLDESNIYPSANRFLAHKILDSGGLLISEYPIGTIPAKFNFPLRNRIIAGLSLGTLLIEAAESSGSLITAKYALEYNREVFAVPGNITSSRSAGTNNLIKQGAKCITSAADVLEDLNLRQLINTGVAKARPELADIEEAIYNILEPEPLHIDKLSNLCHIKINELSATLIMMEMKGVIKNLGGQVYTVIN